MARYHLSLGSNLDPEKNLRAALLELRVRFGALQVSSVYESDAVGFDGRPFWNLVIGLDSDLDADALNVWLHALEDAQGRDRSQPRYADRMLDIDIVAIEGLATDRSELSQAFVLAPLAETAPGVIDPRRGETIGASWTRYQRSAANAERTLRKLDIDLAA